MADISTTNMWLFDVDGKIQKYDSPEAEPFSKERTVAMRLLDHVQS